MKKTRLSAFLFAFGLIGCAQASELVPGQHNRARMLGLLRGAALDRLVKPPYSPASATDVSASEASSSATPVSVVSSYSATPVLSMFARHSYSPTAATATPPASGEAHFVMSPKVQARRARPMVSPLAMADLYKGEPVSKGPAASAAQMDYTATEFQTASASQLADFKWPHIPLVPKHEAQENVENAGNELFKFIQLQRQKSSSLYLMHQAYCEASAQRVKWYEIAESSDPQKEKTLQQLRAEIESLDNDFESCALSVPIELRAAWYCNLARLNKALAAKHHCDQQEEIEKLQKKLQKERQMRREQHKTSASQQQVKDKMQIALCSAHCQLSKFGMTLESKGGESRVVKRRNSF